ncbi:hypothetical protein [Vibrio sinaloensis]|uniref:hypothetical protein n=1 Tax=Photobacterium sp. (strain ATCC 43367) TaxID=379097 RepID=UPI002061B0C6|nr:hypothetical protein [Vibrio sinaloensis]UPQ88747.1 hypothetical protein MTO69_04260 [Vibrio sinaloensis]
MSASRILFAALAALLAWLATHVLVEKALLVTAILICPEGLGSGGECHVSWWSNVSRTFVVFGVGLSAMATIGAAAWVGKADIYRVSRVTYVLGMVAASALVITTGFSGLVLACWFSALCAGWLMVKWLDSQPHLFN